ncbi:MAG: CDGSH iron-sulfur domain-containing protein [Anaerolineales bacterium]
MKEIIVETRKNGPIRISGPVRLVDEEGKETIIEKETIALCRCGGSKNKPFCDGTHRSIGFEGPAVIFHFLDQPEEQS